MTYVAILLCLALLCFACAKPQSASDELRNKTESSAAANRGNEVVAEYLRRDASPFRKSRVRFTITSEGEPTKIYEIETWRRQKDNETATLTRFLLPEEDRDLASLTVESPNKPTTVTSYSAGRDDYRESGTNKMFFGGLTAGELLGEWEKFDYRFLGEKTVEGVQVFALEGNLKKAESGVVAKTEVLMRADIYVPFEIKLFDKTGQHLRTFKIREVKPDALGQYAAVTDVENHVYKTKILLEVLSREYPATMEDSFFTRENLKAIARSK